jgi:hypothetical protein
MIHHYKHNLNDLSYKLKKSLQFSQEFIFIPIKIKNKDVMYQSPRLFTPYGIQINDKSKKYVTISFQNKDNDKFTYKFLNDLEYLIDLIKDKYTNYNVNSFLKTYRDNQIMNIKLKEDSVIYDNLQNIHDDIPMYGYCSFILHLAGLWISKKQIWFQWYILQTRLENNIKLTNYAFKDFKSIPPPPPPLPPNFSKDKYKKMISLGIPSAALDQKLQIQRKASISSDMLSSVILKKAKPTKKIIKSDMNGFEPPSLDSLQNALRNLRNSIKGKS